MYIGGLELSGNVQSTKAMLKNTKQDDKTKKGVWGSWEGYQRKGRRCLDDVGGLGRGKNEAYGKRGKGKKILTI